MLPDFSALSGTAATAERDQAVAMVWATLAPLVGAKGASKELKEGVLKEALAAFAAEGRTPLCLSWHPQNPATPEEIIGLAAD